MYLIKPSVRNLTEDEIRTALNSKDEDNLIVVEFGLMLKNLVAECSRIKKAGGSFKDLLNTTPSCPMEKIALELLTEITEAGGAPERLLQPVPERETS